MPPPITFELDLFRVDARRCTAHCTGVQVASRGRYPARSSTRRLMARRPEGGGVDVPRIVGRGPANSGTCRTPTLGCGCTTRWDVVGRVGHPHWDIHTKVGHPHFRGFFSSFFCVFFYGNLNFFYVSLFFTPGPWGSNFGVGFEARIGISM